MCWALNHQNIIEIAQGHISLLDKPVLHSVGVASLPTSRVTHLLRERDFPFISVEETRQGSSTRPLLSFTSFRKHATVSEKGNIGIPRPKSHRSMIDPRTSLYAAPLPPLPLLSKVVLH
jgi:hypothetical protein